MTSSSFCYLEKSVYYFILSVLKIGRYHQHTMREEVQVYKVLGSTTKNLGKTNQAARHLRSTKFHHIRRWRSVKMDYLIPSRLVHHISSLSTWELWQPSSLTSFPLFPPPVSHHPILDNPVSHSFLHFQPFSVHCLELILSSVVNFRILFFSSFPSPTTRYPSYILQHVCGTRPLPREEEGQSSVSSTQSWNLFDVY